MEGSGEGEEEGAEAKLRPSIPPGIFINWLAELAGCLLAWMGSVSIFPSPFPIELALKWALNCSCSLICFIFKLNNLNGKAYERQSTTYSRAILTSLTHNQP